MRSIRPEAIGPAGDSIGLAALGDKIAIEGIVRPLREESHAPVAALRHVMGQAGDDDAGQARHGAMMHGYGSRNDAMRILSP